MFDTVWYQIWLYIGTDVVSNSNDMTWYSIINTKQDDTRLTRFRYYGFDVYHRWRLLAWKLCKGWKGSKPRNLAMWRIPKQTTNLQGDASSQKEINNPKQIPKIEVSLPMADPQPGKRSWLEKSNASVRTTQMLRLGPKEWWAKMERNQKI